MKSSVMKIYIYIYKLQADFLRNGNIKKVMNLSKHDTTQLWNSLASGTLTHEKDCHQHFAQHH